MLSSSFCFSAQSRPPFQRAQVEKKDDWQKPDGKAGKNWTSKVDYEEWRRVDPVRGNKDELMYINKKVEEEIRSEVERDASMLKAKKKFAEATEKSEKE